MRLTSNLARRAARSRWSAPPDDDLDGATGRRHPHDQQGPKPDPTPRPAGRGAQSHAPQTLLQHADLQPERRSPAVSALPPPSPELRVTTLALDIGVFPGRWRGRLCGVRIPAVAAAGIHRSVFVRTSVPSARSGCSAKPTSDAVGAQKAASPARS
jgi:hypothetical protein